eukprot:scaffold25494_cov25-Phaeocystis_antarctica.AAC.1
MKSILDRFGACLRYPVRWDKRRCARGVVVIAGYLVGSDRVFSGFLPRHSIDISWRVRPDLCFLKCDTDKPDTPALRRADNSEF